VATVDQTFNSAAIAAGLSRGNSDFFGGPGALVIGSGPNDFGIQLITTRSQDEVIVSGAENYTSSFTAPLSVINRHGFASHPLDLVARFTAFNDLSSQNETGIIIESNGTIGFRNVVVNTPNNIQPNPTTTTPVRNKIYFTDNGLASPNKRDCMITIDVNGNIITLTEGTSY
jgi:hypothetical protein